MIAQGMENAGASVISVSPCYPKTEMMKFMVIARYNGDEVDINEIDKSIVCKATTTTTQGVVHIGNFMETVLDPSGNYEYLYTLHNTSTILVRALLF